MNKKFSTLVAGLLLAGAVGTVNAQTFSKLITLPSVVAESVVANGSFQLGNGKKVLALVRTSDAVHNYEYELKMVDANDNINLAETFWKISYSKNGEAAPSFTFVSAAYGIPLSFTAKNADATGAIKSFPGNEAVWKWLPAIEDNGVNFAKGYRLENNYRAGNVDSTVVVVANANGEVQAKRILTSEPRPANALKLVPYVANQVVLTADDLNSLLMTQNATLANGDRNIFKLFFNPDVKDGLKNMWTTEKLTAEELPDNYLLPKMKVDGTPDVVYTEAEEDAAAAAKAAANAYNAAKVVEMIMDLDVDGFTNLIAADERVTGAASFDAAVAAAKDVAGKIIDYQTGLTTANREAEAIKAALEPLSATDCAEASAIEALITLADDEAYHATPANSALVALIKKGVVRTEESTKADVVTKLKEFVDALPQSVAETDLTAGWKWGSQAHYYLKNLATTATYDAEWDALVPSILADVDYGTTADLAAAVNEGLANVRDYAYVAIGKVEADEDVQYYVSPLENAQTALATVPVSEGSEPKSDAEEVLETMGTIGSATADQIKRAINAVMNEYVAGRDFSSNKTDMETALAAIKALDVITDAKAAVTAVLGSAAQANVHAEIDAVVDGKTTVDAVVEAIKGLDIEEGDVIPGGTGASAQWVDGNYTGYLRIFLNKKDAEDKKLYLAVDTNFVTGAAGRRHLGFNSWVYNENIMNCAGDKKLKNANEPLFRDYNGRFAFKFTYFPTVDSLDIQAAGYAMTPQEGTHCWLDIKATDAAVQRARNDEGNGSTVKLAVLTNNHTEATVGKPEKISGAKHETINTRIGFGLKLDKPAAIAEGVYTIQYVTKVEENKDLNGRYIVTNWLRDGQALAKVEDQNLNHIPAAQWMLTHENGSDINTIVNRETNEGLVYRTHDIKLPVQYLYETATANLYVNAYGDSLKFTKVDAEALKDSTLGYFAAAPKNKETNDQLNVYALKYLNNLADVFVNFTEADSILNVTASEKPEAYFRLIPTTDKAVQYGASNEALAKDLKRQAYYLQFETGKANEKDNDKLWITVTADGKYKLETVEDGDNRAYFWLKEFKEADGTCAYALVEPYSDKKVSVKDYPSILVREDLEGELSDLMDDHYVHYYGWKQDGRTSTFMLTAKDAPKYRRLGVTVEDGFNNEGTNYAKFYVTRNANRYLYENTANKVAGYDEDPLGLNFLGDINKTEAKKNLAMFIDTAYVRNNTARPQYMLALNPNFDPQLIDCPYDPTHGKHEVAQVAARYLVTLTDSVAAAKTKTEEAKFKYENRTYTRLAFVDAIHRGDSLIITDSKFKGTDKADKDTINLSKNEWKEGAWQFRLTSNDSEENDGEFYIEGSHKDEYVRLINGVAVLTDNIQDAERFNIESTTEEATANEAVEAAEVSVVATQGAIIVKGAAGKVVTVANILGQTIANQVAASDNVTIAVPAGIAVVTVDGEATKVVVK